MRRWYAAGAAVVFVGASTVLAGPAGAAVSDVPADCGVWTTAYKADGQRISYGYENSTKKTVQYPGDKLAWVPSSQQQIGAAGDTDLFISSELVTHPTDGYLYRLERRGERVNGVWSMTRNQTTRLASGFGGTKVLAIGSSYVYRIAGTALYRYNFSYVNGVPTLSGKKTLAATNWDTVKTFTYERNVGGADVLIGTKTNGQLKEWRIPVATPTSITSKVLQNTGWSGFSSLSTGFCSTHPNSRPLLGITPGGSASVYFDANATDGVGTDIKGGSLGALGWTGKGYGQ